MNHTIMNHMAVPFQFLVMLLTILATIKTCSSMENGYGFITWNDLIISNYMSKAISKDQLARRTIVVSQDSRGDSKTVQGAIDLVPPGNSERIKILIYPGIYREKVIITITKPYISLIGTGQGDTKITWNSKASDLDSTGNPIGTFKSATFAVEADYFCAREIVFENTAPAAVPGATGEQAVALRLSGDKAMLYWSKILGTQDTLFDNQGRHYFLHCFIQGSIDFIFGNAKSLYEDCTLNVVATSYGAVAASQRESPTEDTGFSFLKCQIIGYGMLYLGRAWGRYSRVVYAYSRIDGIVLRFYPMDGVTGMMSLEEGGDSTWSGGGSEFGDELGKRRFDLINCQEKEKKVTDDLVTYKPLDRGTQKEMVLIQLNIGACLSESNFFLTQAGPFSSFEYTDSSNSLTGGPDIAITREHEGKMEKKEG